MATMPNYNPAQVMMGGNGPKNYIPIGGGGGGGYSGGPLQVPAGNNAIDPTYGHMTIGGQQPTGVLGGESVRATGKGPFDQAYRQNLATYSGGQFARPGGNLSFNPTDASTFPGNPTGFGTAPLPGLPDSLVSRAIGGNPFSFQPPQPPAPNDAGPGPVGSDIPDWQFWLKRFKQQGGGYMPFAQ